ncbi:hypothetical protein [Actinomadura sp. 9N407]|uniref:hypothetical protein n=1 Tax=Actinomadura sp. 9N407 TaxID=3375154 RepID=UPI0037BD29CB
MTEAAPAAPFPAYALTPRLAPGIGPDGTYTQAGQIVAFLCGLWAMVAFFPMLVLAALLYTWAEDGFARDPERSRKLVIWSWLCVTVGPIVGALVTAIVVGVVWFAVSSIVG